ncbi:MAG: aspartate kinase [Cytophagaceae bacterium]
MKVLKFGGTSVGKPERMHSVAKLISDADSKIVVLSAVSGTTNALVDIADKLTKGDKAAAEEAIKKLFTPYTDFVEQLVETKEAKAKGHAIVKKHEDLIRSYVGSTSFGDKETRLFLAQGELISTQLFQTYLEEKGYNSVLLPALEFMKTDADSEPMLNYIEEKLKEQLEKNPNKHLYITQGYICLNSDGEVDNLKRGGSDYTGTLIGAALRLSEIQIWTDIDGMHNNDPRIVKRTYPIPELSFDEAAELAYFGAKILHPTCIRPAHIRNVPVRLLNTMQPEQKGTVITSKQSERDVTAVAAKDSITAITVRSTRMLNAYGFLRRIFEVFEKYKTSVDMITTSEVAVSLTIDDDKNLSKIISELNDFAITEVDKDQTIICIVGNFRKDKVGVSKRLFDALETVPVRMISYGGSQNNISVLINTEFKNQALNEINEKLFFAAVAV